MATYDTPPGSVAEDADKELPTRESEIADILEKYKLSGEEEELTKFAEENQGEPWFKVGPGFNELAESLSEVDLTPPPEPVEVPDLAKEYAAEFVEAAKRSRNEAQNVRSKYRELGVNVDLIHFGEPAMVRGAEDNVNVATFKLD